MASELDLLRSIYDYNARVRAKYLEAIWELPPRERYRDRGASYPSLADIFLHVVDAYRFWFLGVYGNDVPFDRHPVGARYHRADVERELVELDRVINSVLGTLTVKDLDRVLTIPRYPDERLTVRTMLVHMIEEELQHRGELNALLWQAGRDAPVVGYNE
jgi:uncharacterized damage-inducible protein DinB